MMRTKPKIKETACPLAKDKADATLKSNTTQVDVLFRLNPTSTIKDLYLCCPEVRLRQDSVDAPVVPLAKAIKDFLFFKCARDVTRRVCCPLNEDEGRVFPEICLLIVLFS